MKLKYNIDDKIDNYFVISKLNLYALGNGLKAYTFSKLCTGSIGKAGNAVNLRNSRLDYAADNIFGNIDAAKLSAAGNIIFAHNNPPK